MEQSISSTIQQNVNFLYKKKLVKHWPSDLVNAELAIKYAWSSDTIFDLLKTVIFKDNFCLHNTVDHENIEIINEVGATISDTQMYNFYKSNLTDIKYFNTLSISKWEYNEFILSAFVFCLERKLHNENLLKIFIFISANYFATLFLTENLLSDSIFSFLVELQLFDFFPKEATNGFIMYLKPLFRNQISIEGRLKGISKFLYIFSFFPVSFIKECVSDCHQQNNLGPMILSLYVLNLNYQITEYDKKFAYNELNNFKKQLVQFKLINNEFVHKCNSSSFQDGLQQIPFTKYYSSFD